MSVDPQSISLSDAQRLALAELADQSGRPWPELFAEAIAAYRSKIASKREDTESFSSAAQRLGLVGCCDGPTDLSVRCEIILP